jgi:gas vesicle protein
MLSGRMLAGVVVGTAVGAVLGMLFAPPEASGTKTNMTRMGEGFDQNGERRLNEHFDVIADAYDTSDEGTIIWEHEGRGEVASFVEEDWTGSWGT